MKKTIISKGDAVLTKKSHPVTAFDGKLTSLLDDMHDTLEEAGGVGLAAPQIGILRRVVIVMDEDDTVLELINPRIVAEEGEQEGFEGCLSLSGKYGLVKRPNEVTVEAQNRRGETFKVTREGLLARCFCHEVEHLDGLMFDRLCDRLFTDEEIDRMMDEKE